MAEKTEALSDDTLLTVIAHVNRAKREADAATTWATQVIPLDTSQQMAEEILTARARIAELEAVDRQQDEHNDKADQTIQEALKDVERLTRENERLFEGLVAGEQAVIDHVVSHWFVQGGKATFGMIETKPANADELVSEILSLTRAKLRAAQPSREAVAKALSDEVLAKAESADYAQLWQDKPQPREKHGREAARQVLLSALDEQGIIKP